MNRVRASMTSICFASFVAACGSSTTSSGGNGGNTVTESGGSGGNGNGGTTAGSGGNGNGGATVGSGGNGSGGAAGSDNGGAAGGGVGGAASGGAQAGGAGSGGKTSANGGTTSSGGSPSGGSQGTGGSASSGGTTTVAELKLVTSSASGYWKTDGTLADATGNADVTIDDSKASQKWEGFGGCFNEMGWNQLTTKALQDEAIGLLYGADGCNFNMGRIPMGASDYAISRYTYDETANDTSMASFSIDRDKDKLIPYIKAAQAVKSGIRFWASPWTPPTWMKSGQIATGTNVTAFDGGKMKSDDSILKAHAQYFVKFVQEYAKQDIAIETVAPQNEPNFEQNYPSCLWDKTTYTSFVKVLGSAFSDAKLTTKIMLGTMSNSNSGKDPDIVTAVMGDSSAKSLITSIGVQWGMLDKVSSYKSSYSDVPIWVSEHKCGNYPWNPSGYPAYVSSKAPNDQAYAVESWGYIRDAIKAGVTAYNAWNMVLDPVGKGIDTTRDWAQDSLLTVSGGTITKTPAYYVFRHFSQFVDPGATVVAATGGDAIAFKNPDSSIIVVLFNKDAAKTMTVSVGGKKLSFAMPAAGWATVNYQP